MSLSPIAVPICIIPPIPPNILENSESKTDQNTEIFSLNDVPGTAPGFCLISRLRMLDTKIVDPYGELIIEVPPVSLAVETVCTLLDLLKHSYYMHGMENLFTIPVPPAHLAEKLKNKLYELGCSCSIELCGSTVSWLQLKDESFTYRLFGQVIDNVKSIFQDFIPHSITQPKDLDIRILSTRATSEIRENLKEFIIYYFANHLTPRYSGLQAYEIIKRHGFLALKNVVNDNDELDGQFLIFSYGKRDQGGEKIDFNINRLRRWMFVLDNQNISLDKPIEHICEKNPLTPVIPFSNTINGVAQAHLDCLTKIIRIRDAKSLNFQAFPKLLCKYTQGFWVPVPNEENNLSENFLFLSFYNLEYEKNSLKWVKDTANIFRKAIQAHLDEQKKYQFAFILNLYARMITTKMSPYILSDLCAELFSDIEQLPINDPFNTILPLIKSKIIPIEQVGNFIEIFGYIHQNVFFSGEGDKTITYYFGIENAQLAIQLKVNLKKYTFFINLKFKPEQAIESLSKWIAEMDKKIDIAELIEIFIPLQDLDNVKSPILLLKNWAINFQVIDTYAIQLINAAIPFAKQVGALLLLTSIKRNFNLGFFKLLLDNVIYFMKENNIKFNYFLLKNIFIIIGSNDNNQKIFGSYFIPLTQWLNSKISSTRFCQIWKEQDHNALLSLNKSYSFQKEISQKNFNIDVTQFHKILQWIENIELSEILFFIQQVTEEISNNVDFIIVLEKTVNEIANHPAQRVNIQLALTIPTIKQYFDDHPQKMLYILQIHLDWCLDHNTIQNRFLIIEILEFVLKNIFLRKGSNSEIISIIKIFNKVLMNLVTFPKSLEYLLIKHFDNIILLLNSKKEYIEISRISFIISSFHEEHRCSNDVTEIILKSVEINLQTAFINPNDIHKIEQQIAKLLLGKIIPTNSFPKKQFHICIKISERLNYMGQETIALKWYAHGASILSQDGLNWKEFALEILKNGNEDSYLIFIAMWSQIKISRTFPAEMKVAIFLEIVEFIKIKNKKEIPNRLLLLISEKISDVELLSNQIEKKEFRTNIHATIFWFFHEAITKLPSPVILKSLTSSINGELIPIDHLQTKYLWTRLCGINLKTNPLLAGQIWLCANNLNIWMKSYIEEHANLGLKIMDNLASNYSVANALIIEKMFSILIQKELPKNIRDKLKHYGKKRLDQLVLNKQYNEAIEEFRICSKVIFSPIEHFHMMIYFIQIFISEKNFLKALDLFKKISIQFVPLPEIEKAQPIINNLYDEVVGHKIDWETCKCLLDSPLAKLISNTVQKCSILFSQISHSEHNKTEVVGFTLEFIHSNYSHSLRLFSLMKTILDFLDNYVLSNNLPEKLILILEKVYISIINNMKSQKLFYEIFDFVYILISIPEIRLLDESILISLYSSIELQTRFITEPAIVAEFEKRTEKILASPKINREILSATRMNVIIKFVEMTHSPHFQSHNWIKECLKIYRNQPFLPYGEMNEIFFVWMRKLRLSEEYYLALDLMEILKSRVKFDNILTQELLSIIIDLTNLDYVTAGLSIVKYQNILVNNSNVQLSAKILIEKILKVDNPLHDELLFDLVSLFPDLIGNDWHHFYEKMFNSRKKNLIENTWKLIELSNDKFSSNISKTEICIMGLKALIAINSGTVLSILDNFENYAQVFELDDLNKLLEFYFYVISGSTPLITQLKNIHKNLWITKLLTLCEKLELLLEQNKNAKLPFEQIPLILQVINCGLETTIPSDFSYCCLNFSILLEQKEELIKYNWFPITSKMIEKTNNFVNECLPEDTYNSIHTIFMFVNEFPNADSVKIIELLCKSTNTNLVWVGAELLITFLKVNSKIESNKKFHKNKIKIDNVMKIMECSFQHSFKILIDEPFTEKSQNFWNNLILIPEILAWIPSKDLIRIKYKQIDALIIQSISNKHFDPHLAILIINNFKYFIDSQSTSTYILTHGILNILKILPDINSFENEVYNLFNMAVGCHYSAKSHTETQFFIAYMMVKNPVFLFKTPNELKKINYSLLNCFPCDDNDIFLNYFFIFFDLLITKMNDCPDHEKDVYFECIDKYFISIFNLYRSVLEKKTNNTARKPLKSESISKYLFLLTNLEKFVHKFVFDTIIYSLEIFNNFFELACSMFIQLKNSNISIFTNKSLFDISRFPEQFELSLYLETKIICPSLEILQHQIPKLAEKLIQKIIRQQSLPSLARIIEIVLGFNNLLFPNPERFAIVMINIIEAITQLPDDFVGKMRLFSEIQTSIVKNPSMNAIGKSDKWENATAIIYEIFFESYSHFLNTFYVESIVTINPAISENQLIQKVFDTLLGMVIFIQDALKNNCIKSDKADKMLMKTCLEIYTFCTKIYNTEIEKHLKNIEILLFDILKRLNTNHDKIIEYVLSLINSLLEAKKINFSLIFSFFDKTVQLNYTETTIEILHKILIRILPIIPFENGIEDQYFTLQIKKILLFINRFNQVLFEKAISQWVLLLKVQGSQGQNLTIENLFLKDFSDIQFQSDQLNELKSAMISAKISTTK